MAVSHLYITCNFLKSEHQGELIACIQKFSATCSPPFPLHPEYRSLSSDTSLSHEATAARHKITIFLFLFIYFIYFFKLLTVEMSPPHGSNSEFWVREQRWSGKKRHKKILFHSTYSPYYIDRIFHRSSELQHRCMTDHMAGQDDHKECSCIHG